jgi:ABC-type glycerol-3-phosphate transport system substrate-binding protein
MKTFQIILLSVFMVLAVAAVLVFAVSKGSGSGSTMSTATVWGTFDGTSLQQLVSSINSANGPIITVNYEQHDVNKIDDDLVNALADGNGPDIVIFPDEKLVKYSSKLYTIPYTTIPNRDFINTYADLTSVLMRKDGVLAVPFAIDPMVMYWNKNLFSSAGIAVPPRVWSELPNIYQKLIKKNSSGGIDRAVVAMGEYGNVNNAKDIIATLFFQSNNPISQLSQQFDTIDYVVGKSDQSFGSVAPAVDFYTGFSNPTSAVYSWNRSEANSLDAFAAGDLAIYFGKASEIRAIQAKNPNLNFDVAPMIQNDNATNNVVKGTLYSMALLKNSKNLLAGFNVIRYLTGVDSQTFLANALDMAPARRDLLSNAPTNTPYDSVFYQSAIQSKTWFDPDPVQSGLAFNDMVQSITSGRSRSNEVLQTLAYRLQNLNKNK